MTSKSIEVSVKGKWVRVPAFEVGETTLITKGKYVKLAVIHDEQWLDIPPITREACVQALRSANGNTLHADIFTFAQQLPATQLQHTYTVEYDSVAAISTNTFDDWWNQLPQATRKNSRRAQKRGVVVMVKAFNDELVAQIREVHNESRFRQGIPNVYFGKSFEEIKRDHSSFLEHSDFICAYHGDELIGFIKLVYHGNVASILNIVPKACHADKRPANLLLMKAVELSAARGMSHLTYGLFNYGNKQDSPLREFKIRNGFTEILVPRYYVPLTAWGALCMKLGLHRGILGILPSRAIHWLVEVRAKWYHVRMLREPV